MPIYNKGRICVWGDSIAFGSCDEDGGGWVVRFGQYTRNNLKERPVYNLGVSGDNSDSIVKRFPVEFAARMPMTTIFATGINDAVYRKEENDQWVEPEKFQKNLDFLISEARKMSKEIIFISPIRVDESKTNPIPWETNFYYKNENIKKYSKIIESKCKKNNLLYIDMYDLLDDSDLPDGLHPNADGHEKMFGKIKRELIKNKIL